MPKQSYFARATELTEKLESADAGLTELMEQAKERGQTPAFRTSANMYLLRGSDLEVAPLPPTISEWAEQLDRGEPDFVHDYLAATNRPTLAPTGEPPYTLGKLIEHVARDLPGRLAAMQEPPAELPTADGLRPD